MMRVLTMCCSYGAGECEINDACANDVSLLRSFCFVVGKLFSNDVSLLQSFWFVAGTLFSNDVSLLRSW